MVPDAEGTHTDHVVDVAILLQVTQVGISLVADTVLDRQASHLTEILGMKEEEVLVGISVEAVLVVMNEMGIEEIVEEAATKT